MFEDSVTTIPSIWASMNSWFTPAVLFVLLNVMIGTIAFTQTLANQNKHHNNHQENSQSNSNQQQQQPNKIARSPSLLQRVRSINFYSYRSQEPNLVSTTTTIAASASSNNDINHFNISQDSHTLFNFEHTQQLQTLENPSHYIFEQSHQENEVNDAQMQYNYFQQNQLENDGNDAQLQFDYYHQENGANDAQMQFNYFQQNHPQNGQEPNTQYLFEHTQEEKPQENHTANTHFEFDHENGEKLEEEEEEDDYEDEDGELQSLDEVYSKLTGRHVSRTKSDTEPSAGEVPPKLPTKMRKSASLKSSFGHFEAEDIVETRRPATVREKATEVDHEVDAKADDFINKFKQQLKLQRLDSIIRYKDMITRGSGK